MNLSKVYLASPGNEHNDEQFEYIEAMHSFIHLTDTLQLPLCLENCVLGKLTNSFFHAVYILVGKQGPSWAW